MKPLIIIPAYNEAENIAFVINDIKEHFQEADILVVNDGSTDSTGEIAKTAGVTVINHPFNMGIGAAMQTGYRYADLKVSIHAPARGATIPLSYMMIWLMFDVDNPTTLQIGEPNCTLHRSWGCAEGNEAGSDCRRRVL
jgi:glycosyltransferase involved in cell wall biosynthesis